MKPTILVTQPWGKHVALEVDIDRTDDKLLHEIRRVQKVISSQAASSVFLLISRGLRSPGEITRRIGKSKFAVSLQISELRMSGLVRSNPRANDDMRRRSYEVSWDKMVDIFRQDYALEFEIYENYMLVESFDEIRGKMQNAELAILGSGKLGVVREVVPDRITGTPEDQRKVEQKMDQLLWEFEGLFRAFIKERQFKTLREYFLGFYRELSMNYRRLPRTSELARFYEFMDRTLAKIKPIDELWRKYVRKRGKKAQQPRKIQRTLTTLKLFLEAGRTDYAGRYILNSEARSMIKPGVHVRIYPSYTFMEQQ